MKILSNVNYPCDLKNLSENNLNNLCKEIRDFILKKVSKYGGHLSSNLGVVELTVALHYIYDTPKDLLIWDIGHQSYAHKILTGRKNKVYNHKGLKTALFPSISESKYDVVSVGHSSTSISVGVGISTALKLKNKLSDIKVICVIGDGAISSGLSFEALNNIVDSKLDILIILNDNGMSISKNVGFLSKNLLKIRNSSKIFFKKYSKKYKSLEIFDSTLYKNFLNKKNVLLNNFNLKYIGPIYGHNLKKLIAILSKIKKINGPKLLHIITKKGYGYSFSEKNPVSWHVVSKFDIKKGEIKKNKFYTYSDIFGKWLCNVAKFDKKLVAITPAMKEGSGMNKFSKKYPNQFFDVSISEQHAVTFSVGLCIGGLKPVVVIYSTFLQRAYDQVIHDIALQKLPILVIIDRAGISEDGPTHNGVFDLSYLRCIPGIVIMTPSNSKDLELMLHFGYKYNLGPTFVRYPKINIYKKSCKFFGSNNKIILGKGVILKKGCFLAILNFGVLINILISVSKKLNATLVDMRFVKPLDIYLIKKLSLNHSVFVTIEENVISGGAGSSVGELILREKINVNILNIGYPDKFIKYNFKNNLNENYIYNTIKNFINS
ncbi:MAG: 1-deoxy-D-xylulose-5-phosphate synthase [Enterobacteriaceae bacterium]